MESQITETKEELLPKLERILYEELELLRVQNPKLADIIPEKLYQYMDHSRGLFNFYMDWHIVSKNVIDVISSDYLESDENIRFNIRNKLMFSIKGIENKILDTAIKSTMCQTDNNNNIYICQNVPKNVMIMNYETYMNLRKNPNHQDLLM